MKLFSYTVVRANWLTRKIDSRAAAVSALVTLFMVFGALVCWGDTWGAESWMPATREQVWGSHQWWRAWTTLLVHADAHHLLANSILFFILGTFVFGYFGAFAFPVLAVGVGGFANLYVLSRMPKSTQLIGMSGVVFWLGGFWLLLYFLIDRRHSFGSRAVRAGGVALGLFMPAEAFDPSISYASHLTGFSLGLVCALIYFLFNRDKIQRAEIRETVVEEHEDPE
jgi:rhomboid protease GluP